MAIVQALARSVARPLTRSCASMTGEAKFRAALFSLRPGSYGQPAGQADMAALSAARVAIFGELHEMPPCIALQERTANAMLETAAPNSTLHIVLEHCNFEQQPLLDNYCTQATTLAKLVAIHREGGEGHDLAAYEPLLRLVHEHPGRVALHAGFIPRSYARIVMRESVDAALTKAKASGYISAEEQCEGSEAHYSFFESLLSGRAYHDTTRAPTDQFRKMFPAQVIKDAAMAHKVSELLHASGADDKVLVVCGIGHSGYGHGVPERILARHPHLHPSIYRIWSLPMDCATDLEDAPSVEMALRDAFGPVGATDPADLCLAFQEVQVPLEAVGVAEEVDVKDADAVKRATAAAYNQVGASAYLRGDMVRARAMLERMGYGHDEIAVAGDDAPNWQGVGCPHRHANLVSGERVLDLGCGLGIDSFIAAAAVGTDGSVTGVDIADAEVNHASERARLRGVDGRVIFHVADLESLPIPTSKFDAIISNGAFCLVPNKAAAFAEAHRVLRPGGRLAVCLSVLKRRELEPGVAWPLCMRTFIPLADLLPACESAGFSCVTVDASDSLMAFELPYDAAAAAAGAAAAVEERAERARLQVHVGSPEFAHLRNVDMNELCARVVVTAVKE